MFLNIRYRLWPDCSWPTQGVTSKGLVFVECIWGSSERREQTDNAHPWNTSWSVDDESYGKKREARAVDMRGKERQRGVGQEGGVGGWLLFQTPQSQRCHWNAGSGAQAGRKKPSQGTAVSNLRSARLAPVPLSIIVWNRSTAESRNCRLYSEVTPMHHNQIKKGKHTVQLLTTLWMSVTFHYITNIFIL